MVTPEAVINALIAATIPLVVWLLADVGTARIISFSDF